MMNTDMATAIARIKRSLVNLKRIVDVTPDHDDARALHLEADFISDQLAAVEANAVAECDKTDYLVAA